MLYQEYKNKVLKFVRILERIRKYKVLILSVALFLILLLSGFLATKGILYESELGAQEFTYGEKIDFSAKALFSDVEYEYKSTEQGAKWSHKAPSTVGEYTVRASARGSFGTVKHTKGYTFKILPRTVNISVSEQSICYGELPTATSDNLASGDTLVCTDFIYGDLSQAVTSVMPNMSTLKIVNKNGEDVTGSYIINIDTNKEITFTKRPVTITVSSASKEYDGQELRSEDYEITSGTLAFDDAITTSTYPSQSGAGQTPNDPRPIFVISNANGLDVSINYSITVVVGTLEVTKRPLIIQTGSGSFGFDDASHENADYVIDSSTSLVSGHKITVTSTTSVRYAGEYENKLGIKITDEGGADVTSNYDITFQYGKLTVDKRAITIETPSASWEYDGTAHSDTAYTLRDKAQLAFENKLLADSVAEITTVGSLTNAVTYKIFSGETDVTGSYDITYSYGTLEVYKRAIELTSGDEEKIYDAKALIGSVYGITLGSVADGQREVVSFTGSITDFGSTQNTISVSVFEGDTDVSANYDISTVYGTLTVTKREIKVAGAGKQKMYDGTPLENKAYTLLSSLDVVSTHTVKYVSYGTITDVGSVDNVIEIEIYEGEENKTSNYIITYGIHEKLYVYERYITVTALSINNPYNGAVQSERGFTISGDGLAPNQSASVVIEGSQKYVGGSVNEITSVTIRDAGGKNVTSNYVIEKEHGYLNVYPRPITLQSQVGQKIYDGLALVAPGRYISTFEGLGLANGERIEYYGSVTVTDASTVYNEFTAEIFAGNEETTENYDITYKFGTLTVDPRPITLVSQGMEKFYDGTELTWEVAYVSDTEGMGLAPNLKQADTVSYEFGKSIIDFGTTPNLFTAKMYSSERGKDTTSNYDITFKYGDLEVLKRPILLSSSSGEKIYDGTPLQIHTVTSHLGGMDFAPNHHTPDYAEYLFYDDLIDVGIKENKFEVIRIYSEERGKDTTDNYDIEYSFSNYEVKARPITIVTQGESKIYDGTPLVRHEAYISTEQGMGLAPNQYLQDDISYVFTGEITFFGTAENTVSVSMYSFERGKDTTSNYEISIETGELRIDKRSITVTAADNEKEYDGTPLYGSEVLIGGMGLATGDSVYDVSFEGSQTIPGTSPVSVLTLQILHLDSEQLTTADATESYEITEYISGTLTVHPRKITITGASEQKIYDGTALTNSSYLLSENALVSGHTISTVTVIGTITDVGTESNIPSDAFIVNENGENVTPYYEITYENGTLEIIPRDIVIVTGSASKDYDGTPLTKDEYYVSAEQGYGLVNGHTEYVTVTGYGVNAGKHENTFDATVLTSSGKDVSKNYNIIPSHGILEIIPIKLEFKTGSATKEYDGTPLTSSEYELVRGSLFDGHTLLVTVTGEQTLAGSSENTVSITVLSGTEDVSVNYRAVLIDAGMLTVTPLQLHIYTGSDSKMYDGTPLTCPIWGSDNWDSLGLYGHTLEVMTTGSITNVGTTPNTYDIFITNADGDDVSSCFEIVEELGELEIVLAPLVYESYSDEFTYDGTEFEYPYGTLVQGCLIAGHRAELSFITVTDAGLYDNEFTVTIYDANGNDVTDIYEIDYIFGTLTVHRRKLTIEAGSAYKKYDGTPLYAPSEIVEPNLELEELNLPFEDVRFTWEVLSAQGSQTEPGESPSIIYAYDDVEVREGFKIYFDGEDVTRNFEITCIEGTLKVSDRLLVINLWKLQKNYDGTPLYYKSYMWYLSEDTQLKPGHTLHVDIANQGGLTEVGSLDNELFLEYLLENRLIWIENDATGEDVTSSYDIVLDGPPLTVTKRKIVLTAASAQKIHDGNPLTAPYFDVSGENANGTLTPSGDRLDKEAVNVVGSVTEVTGPNYGSSNCIDPDSVHIYDINGNETTDNYYIVLVDGELTVLEEDK